MVLSFSDWVFDVDVEATAEYSSTVWKDHCTCGYCRNFYGALEYKYPQLFSFLNQFGMNPLTPEELMPIEPTLYIASYCISGIILKTGICSIDVGNITLTVTTQDNSDFDTSCPGPYFVLTTGFLELPWTLDEDMNEVVSPANEPEYLQRMYKKLMEDLPDTIIS